MSLRAELLRLALRSILKRRTYPPPDIMGGRRTLDRLSHLVPRPPKGTRESAVTAGGVPAVQVTRPASRAGWRTLYLHGGGYVSCSPHYYRDFLWRIADATTTQVLAIDYRLAPEHPFPAAVDDAVAAYRWLLANGAQPGHLAVMGDSAGGGLTLATLLRLRDEGVPLPAAAIALSPWTDLALTGASLRGNNPADPMLNAEQTQAYADTYLAGADPRHPYASPLYGDPKGLPPTLIQVGSDEILRDDAERMARGMHAAGCEVDLQVWPRMPHVWQVFARLLPEAKQAIDGIGQFTRRHLASG